GGAHGSHNSDQPPSAPSRCGIRFDRLELVRLVCQDLPARSLHSLLSAQFLREKRCEVEHFWTRQGDWPQAKRKLTGEQPQAGLIMLCCSKAGTRCSAGDSLPRGAISSMHLFAFDFPSLPTQI